MSTTRALIIDQTRMREVNSGGRHMIEVISKGGPLVHGQD
jgi:hypothetical protein